MSDIADPQDALNQFFDTATQPKSAYDWADKGEVWLTSKFFAPAIKAFEKAIELDPAASDPGQTNWFLDRATAYAGIENPLPFKAILLYQNAKKSQLEGDLEATVKCYLAAIACDPDFSWAHNNLAWTLATWHEKHCRNGEAAVTAATNACELSNWKCWSFLDTLAEAMAVMGNYKDAILYIGKAIELASPDRRPGLWAKVDLFTTQVSAPESGDPDD